MQKKLLTILTIFGICLASIVLMLQYRSSELPVEKTNETLASVVSTPATCVERPVSKTTPPPTPMTNATVVTKTPSRRIENEPKIPKNRQVLLSRRLIAIPEGRKFPTRFCTTQTPTSRKTAPYILISEKPIDRDIHAQAMSDGAKVAGFLPNNALLVEADEEALKNLSDDATFIAAAEYEPMDKIQPNLMDGKDETVKVTIALMNAGYLEPMRDYVDRNGGRSLKTAKNSKSFDAMLPRKMIADLASKGEVRWISASCP